MIRFPVFQTFSSFLSIFFLNLETLFKFSWSSFFLSEMWHDTSIFSSQATPTPQQHIEGYFTGALTLDVAYYPIVYVDNSTEEYKELVNIFIDEVNLISCFSTLLIHEFRFRYPYICFLLKWLLPSKFKFLEPRFVYIFPRIFEVLAWNLEEKLSVINWSHLRNCLTD